MAVWYLDNDDEITDAVARLRAATDDRVVFVLWVKILTAKWMFGSLLPPTKI